jgi:hypothetical protein
MFKVCFFGSLGHVTVLAVGFGLVWQVKVCTPHFYRAKAITVKHIVDR